MARVNLKADDRRRLARQAAVELLAQGVNPSQLSLKNVAAQCSVPFSTLSYVYTSVDDLLLDLVADFQKSKPRAGYRCIGDRGMHYETRRMAKWHASELVDPVTGSILRYMFAVATRDGFLREDLPGPHVDAVKSSVKVIEEIGSRSGETYRMSYRSLGLLHRSALDGIMVGFFTNGDRDRMYQGLVLAADALTLAADPHFNGIARTFKIPDYSRMRFPNSAPR